MKVHLLDSNEPLQEGQDYTALCSKFIKAAQFHFTFDTSFGLGEVLSSLQSCNDCREHQTGKRYLYGLISGQEEVQAALDSTD